MMASARCFIRIDLTAVKRMLYVVSRLAVILPTTLKLLYECIHVTNNAKNKKNVFFKNHALAFLYTHYAMKRFASKYII